MIFSRQIGHAMLLKSIPQRFIRNEDGAYTVFGLFLTVSMIVVGGLGLDVANAIMMRTHLQVAADAAAHAAILARDTESESDSKALAVKVAHASMSLTRFGDTINANDVQFGEWNSATQTFLAVAGSREAVLVNAQRAADRGNAMATYFLRFIGMNDLTVVSQSVFETYRPTCFREGFVAQGRVDVQSNNNYVEGFCIHSNSHVEVNNNNTFENGVIVSMPNEGDLVRPSSGWGSNPGLQNAVRSGAYRIRILQRVEAMIAGFDDPMTGYFNAEYLNDPAITNDLAPGTITAADWTPGTVHSFDCGTLGSLPTAMNDAVDDGTAKIIRVAAGGNGNGNGNGNGGGGGGTVKIASGETLVRGVIYTDCEVDIGSGATLESVLIISESTSADAVSGAADITLGRDDGCAAGGGSQVITRGSFRIPAKLNIFGGQILAKGNIDFAANANGIEGVSMVAGGEIDGTSNSNMGFCNGAGMEHTFQAEYFRMAK